MPTPEKTVILIGDSIRMGYQDTVRERLRDTAEVWGPAENGGNTRNVLAHLDAWVIARRPDIVHVNCGLHDIKRERDQQGMVVPLEEYEANVRAIIERIRAGTDAAVIWALTTPVHEQNHNAAKPFDRYAADVDAVNAAALRVGDELGIPINDLFAIVEEAGRDSLLTGDGVHFTPEGREILGVRVAEAIRAQL